MENETKHNGAVTLEELAVRVERLEREFAAIRDGRDTTIDQLLDGATVCQVLSISYRQLKIYKQRGDIIPVYNGNRCLYPASEVRRFVREVLKNSGHKTKTNITKNYADKQ